MSMDFKVRTWLWVVLATVIVLGGGFTWWQVKGSKSIVSTKTSPTPTKSVVLSPSAKTSSSPVSSSTADWQTYKNDIYGFSLKYPKNWTVTDNLPKQIKNPTFPSESLTITDESDVGKPKLTLWVNGAGWGPFFTDIQYELQKNENTIKINKETPQNSEEAKNDGKQLIGVNPIDLGVNNYWFMFEYNEYKDGSNFELTFKNILSTFQFTQ